MSAEEADGTVEQTYDCVLLYKMVEMRAKGGSKNKTVAKLSD